MALQLTVISSSGYEVQNAYVKVDNYNCSGDIVNARLRAYVSQKASNEGRSYIDGSEDIITLTADYSDNAKNTKKQIYEFAKSYDKYSNAIDV